MVKLLDTVKSKNHAMKSNKSWVKIITMLKFYWKTIIMNLLLNSIKTWCSFQFLTKRTIVDFHLYPLAMKVHLTNILFWAALYFRNTLTRLIKLKSLFTSVRKIAHTWDQTETQLIQLIQMIQPIQQNQVQKLENGSLLASVSLWSLVLLFMLFLEESAWRKKLMTTRISETWKKVSMKVIELGSPQTNPMAFEKYDQINR